MVVYGEENDIILNKDKTTEIILDFRKNPSPLQPLFIRGTEVHIPGTVSHIYRAGLITPSHCGKKAQKRLYFTRLLREACLYYRPLTQAYRGLMEGILTAGNCVVWKYHIGREEGSAEIYKDCREYYRVKASFHGLYVHVSEKSRGNHQKLNPSHSLFAQTQTLHVLQPETQQSRQYQNPLNWIFQQLFSSHFQTDVKTKLLNLCKIRKHYHTLTKCAKSDEYYYL